MNNFPVRSTRPLGLVALLAAFTFACEDSATEPRGYGKPRLSEVFMEDSSATGCAFFDCRSLTTSELQDLQELTDDAYRRAIQAGDNECATMLFQSIEKLNASKVYVARADNYANGGLITGAYNFSSPNETYLHDSRFISIGTAMNTLNHESVHSLRGPRPSSVDVGLWEQDIQFEADNCQKYV